MAETRVVQADHRDHVALLAAHTRRLRDAGRQVVLVVMTRPADQWRGELEAGDDLFFLDATGMGPTGVAFGPDAFYVDSPVKLEKIAMVLRRLLDRFESPHVVLDTVDGLVDYNGEGASVEFCHFLTNQMAERHVPLDLVVLGNGRTPAVLDRLRPIAAQHITLEAA